MFRKFREAHTHSEQGQAIVLVAIALVALIGIMGLLIDGGILFNDYSQLKKAADAAAISAALQYREGYTSTTLTEAAKEFVLLNEVNAVDIVIDTCDTDSSLCTTPRRKLVQVQASKVVDFGFLPIIGIDNTIIRVSAVGEAASVDVVLVIDTSESMAYETDGDPAFGPADNPAECNITHTCEPLESIKAVARDFVNTLYFPYDRVAIVTFDRLAHPSPIAPWITDTNGNGIAKDEALTAIDNLTVYQPDPCVSVSPANPAVGPCLYYDAGGNFVFIDCMPWEESGRTNPTSCTSSNIGGALAVAGNSFAQSPIREDSLWVVILLAGGPANATNAVPGFPSGACPFWDQPYCRDDDASTRHVSGDALYDGDDFARDMADFVTDPSTGQGAVIYAIGLGDKIKNDRIRTAGGDPDIGELLLKYAATEAGGQTDVGIYYYAPSTAELREIFRKIAENIATRLTH